MRAIILIIFAICMAGTVKAQCDVVDENNVVWTHGDDIIGTGTVSFTTVVDQYWEDQFICHMDYNPQLIVSLDKVNRGRTTISANRDQTVWIALSTDVELRRGYTAYFQLRRKGSSAWTYTHGQTYTGPTTDLVALSLGVGVQLQENANGRVIIRDNRGNIIQVSNRITININ